MNDTMLAFLAKHPLCVVSTVATGVKPQSAIVGFSSDAQCNIIIGTSRKSRKFANLSANPSVAVVIGDFEAEVQLEGQAAVLSNDDYKTAVEHQHVAKLPGAAKYRDDPEQAFIKITPTWIRFTVHGDENKIEEFTEFA